MAPDTAQTPATERVTAWWAMSPAECAAAVGAELEGLTTSEATNRIERFGRNELTAAKSASVWQLAFKQVVDPMNLMLLGVTAVSIVIGEISTGLMVGLLVAFNVWSGASQELKAQRSVDALATMQVPQVRVHRDGAIVSVPAPQIAPGDVIELEAGDIVPADARIIRATTLETQEAALTGESAPIEKRADALGDATTTLGDRSSMLYQNTSVTRGTATAIVVATGMDTEMGAIATMLSSVERVVSPLQRELGSLTNVIGIVAWGAVVVIILIGLARGDRLSDLLFLGTAVAISAIPTGLPTFVQRMLAWGANRLTEAKAVVASLNDVETLGATSAICSDKTGTLTMNAMMARSVWVAGQTLSVEGSGYSFEGVVRRSAGDAVDPGAPLAFALALPNDATVSRDGAVIGDPTEAAFVVLAEKLGVDVPETKRRFPREAEVPFDSDYKFMATFHRVPWEGQTRLIAIAKGAPDVLLSRSAKVFAGGRNADPVAQQSQAITDEIERMSSQGLRTLALALRVIEPRHEKKALADPMAMVSDLVFVGVVGIVDPLRPEAKVAVEEATAAGIDIRMITGDHVVTASAIGKELGLTGEALSGADFAALSDDELADRLDHLSVFGRVTPQDKLRLVQQLQARGEVVAMTGDAVNDAAAIKQADIGVAMGSGSEVTKQAAKLILTDDNFATLVRAVRLGRVVYAKIAAYLTFQMSQLVALIALFLAASILNLNGGVALTPVQVLMLNFGVALFAVLTIMLDPAPPGLMSRPPRDPKAGVSSRVNVYRWLFYGGMQFAAALSPLVIWRDDLVVGQATAPVTMCFVITAFGTVGTGLALRRDPESGLVQPLAKAVSLLVWPVVFVLLSTELPFLQRWLETVALSGSQWLVCISLSVVVVLVVDWDLRRRRRALPSAPDVAHAVAPARAR